MLILHQSAPFSSTLLPAHPLHPPFPLLAAPPHRLALPAPKIAGYLPAGVIPSEHRSALSPLHNRASAEVLAAPVNPESAEKRVKRVVQAEIANPLLLIDIRKDFEAWWAEFERIYGKVKTIEEMDAEIEAKHPGYLAWVARRKARAEATAARAEVAS